MVFQEYALFPHLTAAKNIAFGLSGDSRERVKALAALTGITQFLDKYPHELSGGQQQRVALARALAPRPELLLLDEPFSSLDTDLRERLSLELRDIIKASGATAVLVTHDQQEAFAIADEIGVLEGNIPHACQVGCDVCGKGCHAEVLLRPDDIVHDDASSMQA